MEVRIARNERDAYGSRYWEVGSNPVLTTHKTATLLSGWTAGNATHRAESVGTSK